MITKRLLPDDVLGDRTPAEAILAELRTIDPLVELVDVGAGKWWLGCVSLNDDRKRAAEAMMFRAAIDPRLKAGSRGLRLMLAMHGFVFIAEYDGEADGRIVADFRERTWRLHNAAEETFEERLAESAMEPEREERRKRLMDSIQTEGKDAFEFATNNPVSVSKHAASPI